MAHLRTRHAEHDAAVEGVVVVLVPGHRIGEAQAVLQRIGAGGGEDGGGCARPDDRVARTAAWSYNQVLDALGEALGADGDVAQLRGLVEVCEAADIKPLSSGELTMDSEARLADLRRVVDLASVSLFVDTRIQPSGSDEHFTWRRYHQVVGDTYIAIGMRRPHTSADATAIDSANGSASGWTWMRVHASTPGAVIAGEALTQAWPNAYTDVDGHTWAPLEVPVGVSGSGMIAWVAEQAEAVMSTIRAALE